jgi:hypothetical protein
MRKTDNHSLAAKLDLRRFFLSRFHRNQPPIVFDCCQGSGKLWGQLRREFAIARYWGVDLKPKPGRLKVDSSRIVGQPGFRADVVDIDTYGSPWTHWLNLLGNLRTPATVFLTIGFIRAGGGGNTSAAERNAIGATFSRLECPPSLLASPVLRAHIRARMLAHPLTLGFRIVSAMEAPAGRSATYLGIRLEPSAVKP